MAPHKIFLKPKKEESLLRFHPWVFSGAVASDVQGIAEGEVVEVCAANGQFLGVGHYQIGSILVRILSFKPVEIDLSFWKESICRAYNMRLALGLDTVAAATGNGNFNNTYRLVHGEGDNLPGLIIDIYAQTAVIQAHSAGMHLARKTIAQALSEVCANISRIFYKSEGTLPYKAELGEENEYLYGSDDQLPHTSVENGLTFKVDWLKGQKTGFFIDQRDNRSLLMRYARGRNVLNMFCYTGGFSVYALRGGARMVHSVDSSTKAMALTDENVALNFPDDQRHKSFTDDAFKFMENIKDRYDLIILDPPAFAKHKNVLRNALQGYRKLNALAFKQIRSGGIIFTFSCSQIVSRENFRLTVFTAAAMSGRRVRILNQMSQPADHPVNIYHPEGEYLKGLVLEVE